MCIEEAMAFIHQKKWQCSKPGLSRTQALLEKMGNPEQRLHFVHVVGTNGKGSTAACIESILRQAGYRTGLYTSPYIHTFGERIRINGKNISDEALCRLVQRIRPFAEGLEDSPTEFEVVTALGMCYFQEQDCDIVILEAGMGGKTDATNVIGVPEAAVITFIALDHIRELGPTLTDIARAKAGVIKEGCAVISAGNCPEADKVIRLVCREKHAFLTELKWDKLQSREISLNGNVFDYDGLNNIIMPLAGAYQPQNAALAIETARYLQKKFPRITESVIYQGLKKVQWPGRFEIIKAQKPTIVLDGGHNPQGVAATVDSLKVLFPNQKIYFLMGVMEDKAVEDILKNLIPISKGFVTVTPRNPRALEANILAEKIRILGGQSKACQSIGDGVKEILKEAGNLGIVCALGTLYFSDDVRQAVQNTLKINKS